MNTKTLALYLGQYAMHGDQRIMVCGVNINSGCIQNIAGQETIPIDEIKLVLRPLSSMTEEEAIEYAGIFFKDYDPTLTKFYNLGHSIAIRYYDAFLHLPGTYEPKQFTWLLSKGFDLFGLIEKGEALDSTSQPEGEHSKRQTMKTALEQCGGTIKDGLCMKCFNRAMSSSSICIQMYEVEIREPGNEAKKDEDITCPFCGEKGFDKPGLKYHINVYCVDYMNTEEL